MFDTVQYSAREGLATIVLDRPDSLNAFNVALRQELLEAIQNAETDCEVRVILLRSNGRAFCSGADLTEQHPDGQTVEDRLNQQYKPLLLAIVESTKPIIAAVHGAAAGIGCALAMSCDIVVMSNNAYYYQAFAALGIIPDGGISWHLPRQLGSKRAFEMIATGEKMPAATCLSLGLVNRVVDNNSLEQEARAFADQLLAQSPLSLQYSKEAIRRAADLSLADTITMEAGLQKLLYTTDDFAEGKAAFRDKRKPRWTGK